MSFEDLKLSFKKYFQKNSKKSFSVQKIRVKERFDLVLTEKISIFDGVLIFWGFYLRKYFLPIFAAFSLILTGVINAPFFSNQVVGKISSLEGIVEVVRGDERFLVREEIPLFVGDSVIVGHKGKAQINSYNTSSELKKESEIKIEDMDRIFLKKGSIRQINHYESEIQTQRSIIKNPLGSAVEVYVSETGETSIYPLAKNIYISDFKKGSIELSKGEKIKISSDTELKNYLKISDLNLSKTQINSILGKLVITRTKILQGIDLMTKGKRRESFVAFRSAQSSYMSIAQILHSDRILNRIISQNTNIIQPKDVHNMMREKIKNIEILTESKALNIVFSILDQANYSMAFAPVTTDSENFNKYVLLQYLADNVEGKEKELITYLSNNYVVASQQTIMRTMDKSLQEKILKQVLNDIPKNKYGEKFRVTLRGLLPEILKV